TRPTGASLAPVARLARRGVEHAVAARRNLRLEGLGLELPRLHGAGQYLTADLDRGFDLDLGERATRRRAGGERREPVLLDLGRVRHEATTPQRHPSVLHRQEGGPRSYVSDDLLSPSRHNVARARTWGPLGLRSQYTEHSPRRSRGEAADQ